MNLIISLISGILAAFSPCSIVLIPVLTYKFFKKQKNQTNKIIKLVLGFSFTYIIFSYLLSSLFTSIVQNGIKLGLGMIFIILGILSIMNKINPLNFPLIKNEFLLGIVFALILSINPCTLPYLGIIISLSKVKLLLNLFVFGIGLIIPAILFSILGQKFLSFIHKNNKLIHFINKLMSIILILSGVYLALGIKDFGKYDMIISGIILVIIFIILIKAFFLINKKSDFLKINNILLILALIILMIAIIWQCSNTVLSKNNSKEVFFELEKETIITHEVCTANNISNCEICQKCLILFGISLILGFTSILIDNKYKNDMQSLKKKV